MRCASYHNHSVFSDGADTPAELVRQAIARGVDILGVSDHYYREGPGAMSAPDWALRPDREADYFETLRALAAESPIEVRVGLEFDWLEGSAAWLAGPARDPRLDYAIGSVHFIGRQTIDTDRDFWLARSQDEVNALYRRYWCAVRDMAESGLFDIAGHLDLVKKFAVYPTCDLTPEIRDALDAVKASGMVVELNTAGWVKDCRECYPGEAILRACFRREIPVTVSADAHRADRLCADFGRAYDLLARVGYRSLVRFRGRERFVDPLEP